MDDVSQMRSLRYRWHGCGARFAAAIFVGLGIIFSLAGLAQRECIYPGAGFMLIGAFVLLAQRETVVDPAAHEIRVHFTIAGQIEVLHRRWPFSAFDAVVMRIEDRTPSEGGVIGALSTVGLRRRRGRPLWVCYENVRGECRHAATDQAANGLSVTTGLPIVLDDRRQCSSP